MVGQKIFYFSSTHGVGKSTIIDEMVNNYLKNAEKIDLDQFQFYPKGYIHNQITRITNGYETIRNTQAPLVIVDRGPFDALIYSKTLYQFTEKSGLSKDDYDTIIRVFKSINPEYKIDGYIIYLHLSLETNLKNIKNRKKEAYNLMYDEDFLKQLHINFRIFYEQLNMIMHVAQFDEPYDTIKILKEIQRRCWIQNGDLNPLISNDFEIKSVR